MSFLKYGGMQYNASNNIIRNQTSMSNICNAYDLNVFHKLTIANYLHPDEVSEIDMCGNNITNIGSLYFYDSSNIQLSIINNNHNIQITGNTIFNNNVIVQNDLIVNGVFTINGATGTNLDNVYYISFNDPGNVGLYISSQNNKIDISGNTIFRSNVEIQKDLSVEGNLFMKGSLKKIDMSGNNILNTGLLTFYDTTNTGLSMTNTNQIIDISGNTNFKNNVVIQKDLTINGSLIINNPSGTNLNNIISLKFYDPTNVGLVISNNNSNIDISGNTIFRNNVDISGNATFRNNVDIKKDLNVEGNLFMKGTLKKIDMSGNNIINTGLLTLYDPTNVGLVISNNNSNIDISGNTIFRNNVDISGNTIFRNNVDVKKDLNVEGNLFMKGTLKKIDMSGNNILNTGLLTLYDPSNVGLTITNKNNNIDISGNTIFENNVSVVKDLRLSKSVYMDISGNKLDMSGNNILNVGNITLYDPSNVGLVIRNLNNKIDISGNTTFDNNVTIMKDLTVNGTINLPKGIYGTQIYIGKYAGQNSINSNTYSIAIGSTSGQNYQKENSISIGADSGQNNQETNCIAIGTSAGNDRQRKNAVAIGFQSGQNTQGTGSVSLGYRAGQNSQQQNAVAIGSGAGQTNQGQFSIALGNTAGQNSQNNYSIAIGKNAGVTSQNQYAIAVGSYCGENTQGAYSIAIGDNAGRSSQQSNSISIGRAAGNNLQQKYAVSVGAFAGYTNQGQNSVSIGVNAGRANQGISSVAIGESSGSNSQKQNAIAIGLNAGQNTQQLNAIAIGQNAGRTNQGISSIAIGENAGTNAQKDFAIAIGQNAGTTNQGNNSIAIGQNAGPTNQSANSIILNASGSTLNSSNSGLFVAPITNISNNQTGKTLYYNDSTNEITKTTTWLTDNSNNVYTNNNVGIATNFPSYALDVSGIIGSTGLIIPNTLVTNQNSINNTYFAKTEIIGTDYNLMSSFQITDANQKITITSPISLYYDGTATFTTIPPNVNVRFYNFNLNYIIKRNNNQISSGSCILDNNPDITVNGSGGIVCAIYVTNISFSFDVSSSYLNNDIYDVYISLNYVIVPFGIDIQNNLNFYVNTNISNNILTKGTTSYNISSNYRSYNYSTSPIFITNSNSSIRTNNLSSNLITANVINANIINNNIYNINASEVNISTRKVTLDCSKGNKFYLDGPLLNLQIIGGMFNSDINYNPTYLTYEIINNPTNLDIEIFIRSVDGYTFADNFNITSQHIGYQNYNLRDFYSEFNNSEFYLQASDNSNLGYNVSIFFPAYYQKISFIDNPNIFFTTFKSEYNKFGYPPFSKAILTKKGLYYHCGRTGTSGIITRFAFDSGNASGQPWTGYFGLNSNININLFFYGYFVPTISGNYTFVNEDDELDDYLALWFNVPFTNIRDSTRTAFATLNQKFSYIATNLVAGEIYNIAWLYAGGSGTNDFRIRVTDPNNVTYYDTTTFSNQIPFFYYR